MWQACHAYRVQVRSGDRSLPHPIPLPDPTPALRPTTVAASQAACPSLQISSEYVQFFRAMLTLTLRFDVLILMRQPEEHWFLK